MTPEDELERCAKAFAVFYNDLTEQNYLPGQFYPLFTDLTHPAHSEGVWFEEDCEIPVNLTGLTPREIYETMMQKLLKFYRKEDEGVANEYSI